MGYVLRRGVSFCEIEGAIIFLDVVSDRYFGLGDRASGAFIDLVRDPATAIMSDWPAYGLVAQGVLEETPFAQSPDGCTANPVLGTLLGSAIRPSSIADTIDILGCRIAAEIGLKICGLSNRLAAVERLRAIKARGVDSDLATRASTALASSTLWRSRRQRCLSISIASVGWLARRGCHAELIFGVRLHPFQAHCWTQCNGHLVNDPVDAVRNFTPILVI